MVKFVFLHLKNSEVWRNTINELLMKCFLENWLAKEQS